MAGGHPELEQHGKELEELEWLWGGAGGGQRRKEREGRDLGNLGSGGQAREKGWDDQDREERSGKVGWELRQQRVETAHWEGGLIRRKSLWILPAFLGGDKELASSAMASRNLSGDPLFPPNSLPLSTQPAEVLWGTWSRECSSACG